MPAETLESVHLPGHAFQQEFLTYIVITVAVDSQEILTVQGPEHVSGRCTIILETERDNLQRS